MYQKYKKRFAEIICTVGVSLSLVIVSQNAFAQAPKKVKHPKGTPAAAAPATPATVGDAPLPGKNDPVYTYQAIASDVETDVVVVRKSDHKSEWNLKPSDFKLFEGNDKDHLAEQPIREVKIERKPYNLMLVLDASGSMQASTAMVKEAAKAFVETTETNDRVGLMTFFTGNIQLKADLGPKDSPVLQAGIDSYAADGGTPLVDALMQAIAHLERKFPGQRNAIVLLSDGGDNASQTSLAQLTSKLQSSEVTIHIVNVGTDDPAGRAINLQIAQASGGAFLDYAKHTQIKQAFAEMAERLRKFYVIYHTPQDEIKPGTLRHIGVGITNGSQYEAIYRDHYIARASGGEGDQVNTDYITHFNLMDSKTPLSNLQNPAVELKDDLVIKDGGDGLFIYPGAVTDKKPTSATISYCRFTQNQGNGPITLAKGGAISVIGSEYDDAENSFDGTLTSNTGMRLPVNFRCKLRGLKGTATLHDLTQILSDNLAFVNIDSRKDGVEADLAGATTLAEKVAATKKALALAENGPSITMVDKAADVAGDYFTFKPNKDIGILAHEFFKDEDNAMTYQNGKVVPQNRLNKNKNYCVLDGAFSQSEMGTTLRLSSFEAYKSNSKAYIESFSDTTDRLRTDFYTKTKQVFSFYCYFQKNATSKYTFSDVQAITGENLSYITIEQKPAPATP